MQPILPANNGKRRLIKRDTPESNSDFEQVIAPTSLPIERLVRAEESGPSIPKSRRGRPKKARVENPPVEAIEREATSRATATTTNQNFGASQQVDEVVLALQEILKSKRPSTELAYRMPLAVWKVFYIVVLLMHSPSK